MNEVFVDPVGPKNFIVTLIIPFRDSMATLPCMIGSLRAALAAITDVDVEILFVDNGSNDESRVIVDAFCATRPHARCICEPCPGVSAARNAGLAEARGEYIASVDSDDEVAPEYLSELIAVLRKMPDMVLMPFVTGSQSKGSYLAKNRLAALNVLHGWWCWQFVFRRVLCAGVTFGGQCYEDFGFFPRLLQLSDKIAILHGELYYYKDNPHSLTRKSVLWRLLQLEEVGLDLLSDKSLTDQDIVSRVKQDYLRGRMELRAISGFWPILSVRDCVALILLAQGGRSRQVWQIFRLSASVIRRKALSSARHI